MVKLHSITLCKIYHSVYSRPYKSQYLVLQVAGFETELWLTFLSLGSAVGHSVMFFEHLCLNLFLLSLCVQLPGFSARRQLSGSRRPFPEWEALMAAEPAGDGSLSGGRVYQRVEFCLVCFFVCFLHKPT